MTQNVKTNDNGQDTHTPANRLEIEAPPDPFANLDRLRISQDFGANVNVKKVLTVVPCRKPNRQEFVRVNPDPNMRIETAILEDRINRESYMVDQTLWPELFSELRYACLFLAITRQKDVFLWQVNLPGPDGKTNSWNESALQSAQLAQSRWVRTVANMTAGMYDTYQAEGELSDPNWPDLTFQQILKLCFEKRFITSHDHPVLRILRGEE